MLLRVTIDLDFGSQGRRLLLLFETLTCRNQGGKLVSCEDEGSLCNLLRRLGKENVVPIHVAGDQD
jgi:hypothetical protein